MLNNNFLRRRVDHLGSQKGGSEVSSLAGDASKKKARGKSKAISAFPPPPRPDLTLHPKPRTQNLGKLWTADEVEVPQTTFSDPL